MYVINKETHFPCSTPRQPQGKKNLGGRINPSEIQPNPAVVDLIENTFLAYNAGRIREACHLLARKVLKEDVTVGMSLAGALTPAGLGISAIIPLIKAGFVDWIVSTGANLYHDAHFGIGLPLHQGSPFYDDVALHEEGLVRIYDVIFEYDVLLSTDTFFREIISLPEFQRTMSTAEFHYLCGKYIAERERVLGIGTRSILSAAYQAAVPVYTSSPGDSSIGMNVAAKAMLGNKLQFDVSADVNETAAIVFDIKKKGGKSAVLIFGGGSPKNFMLQTEPQIQEVLGLEEEGHDYFIQVTDARPDTGGLSGATPSEAVSWGKIDPSQLPDTVVVYSDTTIAMPLMASYALSMVQPRQHSRLFKRRAELVDSLRRAAYEEKK
ncbi:MAG: deoxyhypusine synthase [Bacillota bacterium]|nr:deoxyhypusine synthase [Bacillota bacterium]